FLDVAVPALAGRADLRVDVFTHDGRPLPPLFHRIAGTDALVGTADAQESVLRVAGGATLLTPPADGGPIVITPVRAVADPAKRARPFTVSARERVVVF